MPNDRLNHHLREVLRVKEFYILSAVALKLCSTLLMFGLSYANTNYFMKLKKNPYKVGMPSGIEKYILAYKNKLLNLKFVNLREK